MTRVRGEMRETSPRMTLPRIALAFALLALLAGSAPAAEGKSIRIATWNVENLFDVYDDPDNMGDDDFVAGTWRAWNTKKYDKKIRHLADVIAAMKPDAIGLQEVENLRVVRDLAAEIAKRPGMAGFTNVAHVESADYRGIDCALITRFEIMDCKMINRLNVRRGNLVARLDTGNGTSLYAIVCHWKSWSGNRKRNFEYRMAEAKESRIIIDDLLSKNPNETVLLLGDLNEHHTGATFVKGLNSTTNKAEIAADLSERLLYSAVEPRDTYEEECSYFYGQAKRWTRFDQIIVPRTMLLLSPRRKGPCWRVKKDRVGRVSEGVFRFPAAIWKERDNRPMPFRRHHDKTGVEPYIQGYSDHFPVYLDLVPGSH